MANLKPTAQMGALTLVFLVKEYRSQMIALLVKNGIVVNNNTTEEEIAKLMANLLKVSKSYGKDLQNFISNPSVARVIGSQILQTAQYYKMSGNEYFNADDSGDILNIDEIIKQYDKVDEENPTDPVIGTKVNEPAKKGGFFSDLKLADLINKGFDAFKDYTKGQSDAEIARQRARTEEARANAIKAGNETFIDPSTGKKVNVKDDEGMKTSTIVIISVVGVALLGTLIYFIARPKK